MSSFETPRRPISVLLALILVATGIVIFTTRASSAPAEAAPKPDPYPSAKHAVGMILRGQWFGSWRTADGRGFCIEFDRSSPNNRGAVKVGRNVPGMNTATSARVRYVTNAYGLTRSNTDGAAAAIYVWQSENRPRFRRYYARMVRLGAIPDRVLRRVHEIAAEARDHGPYTLAVRMGSGYVGQLVTGTATVRAANGHPVARKTVSLSTNANANLTMPSQVSDGRGQVGFRVRVTSVGAVRVDARLTTPDQGVWVTRPSGGRQRLVLHGRATMSTTAYAASQRTLNGPQVTSACTGDCQGAAPVTVTMRNACGGAVLREFVYSNGRLVAGGSVDVAPCRTARTTVTLPDNAVVTTRYCYLNAAHRCIAAPAPNPGSLRVVCPPAVEYRFTGSCPCGGPKTISYAIRAPATSTRRYTITQIVRGVDSRTTTATLSRNGVWQQLPAVTLTKGVSVEVRQTVLGRTQVLDAFTQTG